jgi:hypothetical protein
MEQQSDGVMERPLQHPNPLNSDTPTPRSAKLTSRQHPNTPTPQHSITLTSNP